MTTLGHVHESAGIHAVSTTMINCHDLRLGPSSVLTVVGVYSLIALRIYRTSDSAFALNRHVPFAAASTQSWWHMAHAHAHPQPSDVAAGCLLACLKNTSAHMCARMLALGSTELPPPWTRVLVKSVLQIDSSFLHICTSLKRIDARVLLCEMLSMWGFPVPAGQAGTKV